LIGEHSGYTRKPLVLAFSAAVAALNVPENTVKHLFDEVGKDGDLTRALDVGECLAGKLVAQRLGGCSR
jgi:hypothetical protein